MPIDTLQREVAAIALRTAAQHGFALAGGNALIAHGLIDRPTDDVDLFSDQEAGVAAAAQAVERALREAGFRVSRRDMTAGLGDLFEGMDEELAEWIITAPGGRGTSPMRCLAATFAIACSNAKRLSSGCDCLLAQAPIWACLGRVAK